MTSRRTWLDALCRALIIPASLAVVRGGLLPSPVVTRLEAQRQLGNATVLDRRQIATELSTCGFKDGDPESARLAKDGFNCRIDTRNGLWGFCPTTVIVATDCGLAGSCVDGHECSDGCGLTDKTSRSQPTEFCSNALLTFGVDQTYTYVACGSAPTTENYLISPTIEARPPFLTADEPAPSTSSAGTGSSSSIPEPARSSSVRASTSPSASDPDLTPNPDNTSIPSSDGGGDDDESSGSSIPVGAIIGGAVGGLALLCISGVVAIYIVKGRGRRAKSPRTESVHSLQGGAGWKAGAVSEEDAKPEEQHPPKYVAQVESWGRQELDSWERRTPAELAG